MSRIVTKAATQYMLPFKTTVDKKKKKDTRFSTIIYICVILELEHNPPVYHIDLLCDIKGQMSCFVSATGYGK